MYFDYWLWAQQAAPLLQYLDADQGKAQAGAVCYGNIGDGGDDAGLGGAGADGEADYLAGLAQVGGGRGADGGALFQFGAALFEPFDGGGAGQGDDDLGAGQAAAQAGGSVNGHV